MGSMAKTALATTDQDNRQTEEGSSDGPLMDTTNLAVKNLIKKGKERGILTHDEVNSALPPIQFTSEQIEDVMSSLSEMGVNVIENEETEEANTVQKDEQDGAVPGNVAEDDVGRTDDPVRMYLREMGGVELLSREGEIAIAKRIEAGKDVMLIALSQSPITAQQFFEWNDQLHKDEILVREIIDIDTNYMEDESTGPSAKQKNSGETEKEESNSDDEDDFNPTLAAMETEIKPKVLKTVNTLTKEYSKLIKYQKEKLECVLQSQIFSPAKEKGYQNRDEKGLGFIVKDYKTNKYLFYLKVCILNNQINDYGHLYSFIGHRSIQDFLAISKKSFSSTQ